MGTLWLTAAVLSNACRAAGALDRCEKPFTCRLRKVGCAGGLLDNHCMIRIQISICAETTRGILRAYPSTLRTMLALANWRHHRR